MEKKKFITIIVSILVVLNLGLMAFILFAPGTGRQLPPGRGDAGNYIIHELDMNEEQINLFEEMKHRHHEQMMQYKDSLDSYRKKLFNIQSYEDSLKASEYAQKMGHFHYMQEWGTYLHFKEVYEICNEKQRSKFDEVIGEALKMMRPGPGDKRPPR